MTRQQEFSRAELPLENETEVRRRIAACNLGPCERNILDELRARQVAAFGAAVIEISRPELAEAVRANPGSVSEALRKLQVRGLLQVYRTGRWSKYEVDWHAVFDGRCQPLVRVRSFAMAEDGPISRHDLASPAAAGQRLLPFALGGEIGDIQAFAIAAWQNYLGASAAPPVMEIHYHGWRIELTRTTVRLVDPSAMSGAISGGDVGSNQRDIDPTSAVGTQHQRDIGPTTAGQSAMSPSTVQQSATSAQHRPDIGPTTDSIPNPFQVTPPHHNSQSPNPPMDGSGLRKFWDGNGLTEADLTNPARLQSLWEAACQAPGLRGNVPDHRVEFFALAGAVLRQKSVSNRVGLFVARLKGPDAFGKEWWAYSSDEDRRKAKAIIRKLDELGDDEEAPADTGCRVATTTSPAAERSTGGVDPERVRRNMERLQSRLMGAGS
jgi:hypothetical protein